MRKYYHHPTFVQYKQNLINLFPFYSMKKNSIREKNIKRKKNQIGNIFKKKNSCPCIESYFAMYYS